MGQITITWMDGELFEFNPNLLTHVTVNTKKIHPNPIQMEKLGRKSHMKMIWVIYLLQLVSKYHRSDLIIRLETTDAKHKYTY
jgi:hypothetical protein